jgi:hypothetical protein
MTNPNLNDLLVAASKEKCWDKSRGTVNAAVAMKWQTQTIPLLRQLIFVLYEALEECEAYVCDANEGLTLSEDSLHLIAIMSDAKATVDEHLKKCKVTVWGSIDGN